MPNVHKYKPTYRLSCLLYTHETKDQIGMAYISKQLEEGALDAIIFLGMMFGGYFWGSWSDVVGRRSCLITSLTVNGLFGFASALAPTYTWFLFFRFGSAVG